MIRVKALCLFLLFAALILLTVGCGDRRDLEDLTIALVLGIDLDSEGKLVIYESSPVFNKNAKDKEEEIGYRATTFREAREKFDSSVTALTVYGKTEVILVGKKLLEQKGWTKLLDHFYRDSQTNVTARIVAVDGPVSDIIQYMKPDKPRLPTFLSKLIDTGNRRQLTVNTTLQELRRQMTDKAVTPAISQIRKDGDVELLGTALLDEQGKFAADVSFQDSALLQILRKQKGDISLALKVPAGQKKDLFDRNQLTLAVYNPSVKVTTDYRNGRFHFDMKVRVTVRILEKLFPFDVRKEQEKLEQMIEEQLRLKFQELIEKIQRYRIDPLGLGSYARAYRYPEWKQVQNRWGAALAQADIQVEVKAKIKYMGAVK
ncbi:Ger(x)C family spore germination protein [Paenibacillus sp. MBLB4367]|uniref:Ger(x)C family spore germination protein n=1 Tax=Paenibacillus sp. MBLB4367 TaxID=3384767 RepID=UPI00390817E6